MRRLDDSEGDRRRHPNLPVEAEESVGESAVRVASSPTVQMAIARSLSPSSVKETSGPDSVMAARVLAHPRCTGSANANEELPSPSATSGIAKLKEKSAEPLTAFPVIWCSPEESGKAVGASATKAGSRNGRAGRRALVDQAIPEGVGKVELADERWVTVPQEVFGGRTTSSH